MEMSGETFNPVLPGIGIFGTGVVVRVLTPILKRSGFRVVALWGRTPEDAQEVAADLVIPFHTSRFEGELFRPDMGERRHYGPEQ